MAQRIKLTSDYVDNLRPPQSGEKWISDIIIKGFGLRIWGGKNSGKSFAIRVIDQNGKVVRKTICSAEGRLLERARKKAQKEIDHIKGIKNLSFRERIRVKWEPKLKEIKLDELAELALEIQNRTTKSKQYVLDNDYRYKVYVSPHLGKSRALDLKASDLTDILEKLNHKPSQKRNLQSFFSYMLTLAYDLSYDFHELHWDFKKFYRSSYTKKEIYYDNKLNLKPKDFEKLFYILKREKEYKNHADFIYLLFLFSPQISPSRFLKSTSEEFTYYHSTYSSHCDSDSKKEHFHIRWTSNYKYKKYYRYELKDEDTEVLINLFRRNNLFYKNKLLFPSLRSHKSGHITSYTNYWKSIKDKTGLPDISLKELVANYHWSKSHFKICKYQDELWPKCPRIVQTP